MQPKLFRRFDRQAQNHIGATLLACTQYRANPAKLQMHGTRFEYFLIQVPCRFVGFGRGVARVLYFSVVLFLGVGSLHLTPHTQCVENERKRGRWLPTAWVIQVIAREGRAPVFQYAHQASFFEVGPKLILRQIGHAQAAHRSRGNMGVVLTTS